MFIKSVDIDWLTGITCLFVKFGENLPRLFFEILKSKFQKSELGKFIPNFFLKHMINGTNFYLSFLVG